jgi:hypothetical protein
MGPPELEVGVAGKRAHTRAARRGWREGRSLSHAAATEPTPIDGALLTQFACALRAPLAPPGALLSLLADEGRDGLLGEGA